MECCRKDKEFYSRIVLRIAGVLALGGMAFFVIKWLIGPSIFHPELLIDIPNFLHGEATGLYDYVSKIFNLQMIESGCYRPRLLGFAVQYADIKIWMLLNNFGIPWGGVGYLQLLACLY